MIRGSLVGFWNRITDKRYLNVAGSIPARGERVLFCSRAVWFWHGIPKCDAAYSRAIIKPSCQGDLLTAPFDTVRQWHDPAPPRARFVPIALFKSR